MNRKHKGRKNLSIGSVLQKSAAKGAARFICCKAPRPQPRRRSRLASLKAEIKEMHASGKTLNDIRDWVTAQTGKRPRRAALMREIRDSPPKKQDSADAIPISRAFIRLDALEVEVCEVHGLPGASEERMIKKIACAIARDLTRLVKAKDQDKERFPIRSLLTRKAVQASLITFGRSLALSKAGSLRKVPAGACQLFLHARTVLGLSREQLKKDKMALEFAFKERLSPIKARSHRTKPDRAATREQVEAIKKAQSKRHSESTELAYDSGCRASELATIARLDEQPPSARQWHPKLFNGRSEGILYTVMGKGGLVRLVMLSPVNAALLESKRRTSPIRLKQGSVFVTSRYDISSGDAWASSFRRAAKKVYGISPGAHATRHGYVRGRRQELAKMGLHKNEIEEIISQELGHFRKEIVQKSYRNAEWNPLDPSWTAERGILTRAAAFPLTAATS